MVPGFPSSAVSWHCAELVRTSFSSVLDPATLCKKAECFAIASVWRKQSIVECHPRYTALMIWSPLTTHDIALFFPGNFARNLKKNVRLLRLASAGSQVPTGKRYVTLTCPVHCPASDQSVAESVSWSTDTRSAVRIQYVSTVHWSVTRLYLGVRGAVEAVVIFQADRGKKEEMLSSVHQP